MGKKTGLAFFPAFDFSISENHPEREERLLYTYDQLREEGIFDLKNLIICPPKTVDKTVIERTHLLFQDSKKHMNEAYYIALGNLLSLADYKMQGKIDNGFAIIRPPGHHAMHSIWGGRGFCHINHVAILTHYLKKTYGIKKIAIIDTDCHHGDGTQDIFLMDPDILFVSLHQDGKTLYPGTGFINEKGSPYSLNIFNFPLPPLTGEKGFVNLIEHKVLPLIKEFKPDIIINCAGQDNHYTDPLTNMKFSSQGYAYITKLLNPDIVILEGGYSVEDALPYMNLGILLALMDKSLQFIKEPDYHEDKVSQSKDHDKVIDFLIHHTDTLKDRSERIEQQFLKDQSLGKDSVYYHNQNIYYDTDGILESQEKEHHACPYCKGYVITKSKTEQKKGCAVTIFENTCDSCCTKAMEDYNNFLTFEKNSIIILQDRKNERYLRSE